MKFVINELKSTIHIICFKSNMQCSEIKRVHKSYEMHNALNLQEWPGIRTEKFGCFIKKINTFPRIRRKKAVKRNSFAGDLSV